MYLELRVACKLDLQSAKANKRRWQKHKQRGLSGSLKGDCSKIYIKLVFPGMGVHVTLRANYLTDDTLKPEKKLTEDISDKTVQETD